MSELKKAGEKLMYEYNKSSKSTKALVDFFIKDRLSRQEECDKMRVALIEWMKCASRAQDISFAPIHKKTEALLKSIGVEI